MVKSDNSTVALSWLNDPHEFQQHERLLNLSHDAIWVRDLRNRILFWNLSAEKCLGWPAPEAIGKTTHVLLRPQFPKSSSEINAQLHASGSWEGRVSCTTRDGRLLIFASRWLLERDHKGEPLGVIEFNRNLTEELQAEEALRMVRAESDLHVQARLAELDDANVAFVESQERFRQIANNIRDVVWLANPTMTSMIYVNPAYQEIWGRPCEELYQNPRAWFQGIHAEDRPRLRHFFDHLQSINEYEHSYRVVHTNGTVRWLLERGFPVHDNAGRFYRLVGIARDITQHRLLEKEILAISEREQQRLGQDLHDDLCQQLVGIEFLSKALEQQLAGKAAEHPAPATFANKAGEIAQLIRAAIGHTRVLARGLAPFGLQSDGLAKALTALATRTSELFRIECSLHGAITPQINDLSITTNLYRIAQEAVTNSVKHGKATQVKISLNEVGEGLRLSIEDNGSGFSSAQHPATGMGLRIMQYRADMMAATFSLETSEQGGALVVCTVPFPRAEPARSGWPTA